MSKKLQTETRAETTAAPVMMERLNGGKGIVRVGDTVTPTHNPGPAWTIEAIANMQAAVKYEDGRSGSAWVCNLLLTSHSELQARAQLESVREMVERLKSAVDCAEGASKSDPVNYDREIDAAREAIQQDALEVTMRSGWYSLCSQEQAPEKPAEFCILLCTGGPAVRIIGTLDGGGEPESARLEHQDWGTPWTPYRLTADDEQALLSYAREFCFAS